MAMMDLWRSRQSMPARVTSGASPLAELTRMQRDLENMLERFFGDAGPGSMTGGFAPPVDIVDRGTEVVVRADLPGMEQKDIQIELQDGALSIRGERREARDENKDTYRWSERWEGVFMRTIPLPTGVDPNKIQAQFKNGVLEVHMPKKQEAATKKIEVKGG
jgi:HSP20 family protein